MHLIPAVRKALNLTQKQLARRLQENLGLTLLKNLIIVIFFNSQEVNHVP